MCVRLYIMGQTADPFYMLATIPTLPLPSHANTCKIISYIFVLRFFIFSPLDFPFIHLEELLDERMCLFVDAQ